MSDDNYQDSDDPTFIPKLESEGVLNVNVDYTDALEFAERHQLSYHATAMMICLTAKALGKTGPNYMISPDSVRTKRIRLGHDSIEENRKKFKGLLCVKADGE